MQEICRIGQDFLHIIFIHLLKFCPILCQIRVGNVMFLETGNFVFGPVLVFMKALFLKISEWQDELLTIEVVKKRTLQVSKTFHHSLS